jgi:hypothetical protein
MRRKKRRRVSTEVQQSKPNMAPTGRMRLIQEIVQERKGP